MMIVRYASKKLLKEAIGKPLRYTETSMFGDEYKENGTFCGSNRPVITGIKNPATGKRASEFFASITMANGLISKVK